MFATLLGALPMPDGHEPTRDAIRNAIRAQEAAGLEPITDGRLGDPQFEALEARLLGGSGGGASGGGASGPGSSFVEAWQLAAGMTDRAVKQALPGPYSIGWRADAALRADAERRADAALRAAAALRQEVEDLARAGCPLVEIEESEAHRIGGDKRERELFAEAHRIVTQGIAGTHLSLSIVGGPAWEAGLETILAAPYASLAVDVIAGPDNWNLVTRLPGDRGVVVGSLPAGDSPADAPEMLLWAARYAAAARGRGLDRVGLGSAGSWANLTWEAALAKLDRLGAAARLAAQPAGENLARELDPRAVSARSAALGAVGPRRRRPPPAG